jgi:hypothetical protein
VKNKQAPQIIFFDYLLLDFAYHFVELLTRLDQADGENENGIGATIVQLVGSHFNTF